MTLLSIAAAVGLLILLIAAGRVPPFVAFIISSIAAALMLGLPLEQIPQSIERGIGDMLGPLSIIICLGAMFGKLIADSGAAERISQSLIQLFGQQRIALAMSLTGFIVGIPLFYNVGFVLMVPLIFSVVYRSKLPVLYVGIPMLAGLSISHGFLPPHPSPAALVNQFGADMGLTLIYGLLVGVPTLLIAGPIFALTLRKVVVTLPDLFKPPQMNEASLPSTFNSFACALLPVVLIAAATALSYAQLAPNLLAIIRFIGNPMIGLLLSLAIGTYTLGAARGLPVRKLMLSYADAVRDIAAILLIIAGAGALKQIFIDSGANNDLGALLA
ncbi:MAG: gluconate:H+ symporter, partial [Pseudomonadota bacterium]|nr:gluconate:H+ symporter [Pseudomonadota bacterium]